ncbi:ABC transporter permease [Bradyrhizobium erythrophlei]|jgi:putative spermidine/putrescine transport system permease protein|uniref:Putative spermidine/putrescine transport system permease protein n=1 Tax=Bradyrhizobium erythrophlei TaxID=1437360 RepID=A0A1M5YWC6_9BRAD|nr:ABC transporter permease [Bradyrhizobium erythrophlei]SHI16372.1 putative spermidine/putrescine transport system permease protein [Bradyrhizobium erythrophlei]
MENSQGSISLNARRRVTKRGRRAVPYKLTAPAFVFVTLLLVIPLLMMLRLSLYRYDPVQMYVQALTFENYVRFFRDEFYQQVLWTTLWISAVTTMLCLVGGLAVAYYVARTRSAVMQRYLILAIVLPLFMGNVARTAGWIIILDNKGLLNFLLQKFDLASGAVRLLYTSGAVITGLTSVLLPFMIVTLNSVMHNIDISLEEASLNLGASGLTTFRRIVLPLLMPGIFAGCVLCFILSMNAYATPILIGGPKFYMMAPTIYSQMSATMNWPFGAALAFILISLTMVLTVVSAVIFNRSARAGVVR